MPYYLFVFCIFQLHLLNTLGRTNVGPTETFVAIHEEGDRAYALWVEQLRKVYGDRYSHTTSLSNPLKSNIFTMQGEIILLASLIAVVTAQSTKKCENLMLGQYKCDVPEIDIEKQTEKGCRKNKTVLVTCRPSPNITCSGQRFNGNQVGFYKEVPCRYVGETSFETALLLSVFLGVFGIDRFYLGYPAIGILKFCTLGFFMVLQLIDVILIATQVLRPADGSDYIISYFGPRLNHLTKTNETFIQIPRGV